MTVCVTFALVIYRRNLKYKNGDLAQRKRGSPGNKAYSAMGWEIPCLDFMHTLYDGGL